MGWQPAKKIDECIASEAFLPSIFGKFKVLAFRDSSDLAVLHGDVFGKEDVPVRLHSECITGDVFGSERCDCQAQLHLAIKIISKLEYGLIIYLRQEGRGIGLYGKIMAYGLQDIGYDTVEANQILGFQSDQRTYDSAVKILKILGIKSVNLLTNNPHKVESLRSLGIITRCSSLEIKSSLHNDHYLKTKKEKMGHTLKLC